MDSFPSIGIREFRQNLHRYTTTAREPFAVTSQGRALGYFIPAHTPPAQADFDAFNAAAEKLETLMRDKGLTEEQVLAEFERLRKMKRNHTIQ